MTVERRRTARGIRLVDEPELPVQEMAPHAPATLEERAAIRRGLEAIMAVQARNARLLPDSPEMGEPGSNQAIRNAHQALMVELGEVYNSLGVKPWRKSQPIDAAHLIDELGGDVLHFLGWLLNELALRDGLTPENWAAGFWAKSITNIARFQGKVPGREPPDLTNVYPRGGGDKS